MADDKAQSKTHELDDGFKTIHLPFYSDKYDQLKISRDISLTDNEKDNYYKLCNVYELEGYLYSNNAISDIGEAKYIDNAIISKSNIELLENKDRNLYSCIKYVSDIPCDSNKDDVKDYIKKKLEDEDSSYKDVELINRCMGIQTGGGVTKHEEHQLLTQEQLKLCTKDTISSDDWWKDENTYVEVKIEDTFINVDKEGKITSEKNDTYQDVYMTWTDYIKLTFDNIDGLNTSSGETFFTNLPEGIRVSLKNDEDTEYSKYRHTLKIVSYDNTKIPSTVTLEVDDETNSDDKKEKIILNKAKFMELFHSAGGGGVVRNVDHVPDIKKKYINQNQELIGEDKIYTNKSNESKKYTLITFNPKQS